MISYEKPSGGEYVTEPQKTGVVQVRRSIVLLAVAALAMMILLVMWYVAQRPQSQPHVVGSQYHPADVTALDRDYGRHSNAIGAPTPRHGTLPAAQPDIDPCLLTSTAPGCAATAMRRAPNSASTAAQNSAVTPSSASSGADETRREAVDEARREAADAAQRRAEEGARVLAVARDSDMKVRLDDDSSLDAKPRDVAGVSGTEISAGSGLMAATSAPGEIPPIGTYVLERGMSIPLTLENGVDSTLGGMVVAQVSENVYDAAHRAIVIPHGSKAIGEYSNATTQEQGRLYCTIDTIKLPNHSTIRVDDLPCVDTDGRAGIPARVDAHRKRIVGDVAAMSVLAAGAQLAQPQGTVFQAPSVGSTVASSVGTQIANLGTQEVGRSLALGPTLHVDEGTPFAAMVKTDIAAQPYRDW